MPTDHLSTTFAALADPTRRAILARLAADRAPLSVTELAKPFAMTLPAVTKHLQVLRHAGLVTQGRQAQWRPCQLDAAPLRDVADWVAQYRRFWEERLDRLEVYLRELQSGRAGFDPAANGRRRPARKAGAPTAKPDGRVEPCPTQAQEKKHGHGKH